MCLLASDAHLSNTQIFASVCGTKDGKPARQFTVYKNSITITNPKTKDNFMCLPVPLKSGLEPKEHIKLYDFSSKDYTIAHFFETLVDLFKVNRKSLTLGASWSSNSRGAKLEVVKIGGYLCSLASSPSDVLNLDEDVFGKPVDLHDILAQDYAQDFAFLICKFSQDGANKQLTQHPIAYSHPISADGKLFIPTKHYHGGKPNLKFVNDWDHDIFVYGADISDIHKLINNASYKKFDSVDVRNPTAKLGETAIPNTLSDIIFKQHGNIDSLPDSATRNDSQACKLNIKGRFDNVDFTPRAICGDEKEEEIEGKRKKKRSDDK